MEEKKKSGRAEDNIVADMLTEVQGHRDRAEKHEPEDEGVQTVIFTLSENYFAFPGSDIREILTVGEIAYVPGCPDHIMGIINLRGDIESVLSLHKLMGLPATELTDESRIVIAARKHIRSGILVDAVKDIIEVPSDAFRPPLSTLAHSVREFALGGETIYGNQYVTLLDIGKIFDRLMQ